MATATEGGRITLSDEGQSEKRPRVEKSDTETEAAGGEAGPSQSHYKKGYMTNVYLTDSEEEAIKPGHPTHSAEPSGQQRTAEAIQRADNFLHGG